jgi:hypothetical protein
MCIVFGVEWTEENKIKDISQYCVSNSNLQNNNFLEQQFCIVT